MNVIKQIVADGEYGTQTIKMVVRSNERGPQGERGEAGAAATITAGEAYSVPSNQEPSVMNTGTSSDAVFDFYIPKGEKGAPGRAASVNIAGTQTLPSGFNAFVRNEGDDHDARLLFGIPQGIQGAQGVQGEQGEQGEPGKDGSIHYTAGTGIRISAENQIFATGEAVATWGGIIGDINSQTDLQESLSSAVTSAEAGAKTYTDTALTEYTKTADLPAVNNATLTITNDNQSLGTFTANASSNVSIEIGAPVITMTDTDPGEGAPLAANHFIFVYS